MGAEENEALIQRFYDEGWNANNLDVYDELVTDGLRRPPGAARASSRAARGSRC